LNFSGVSRKTLYGRALRWPLRLIPKRAELRVLQGSLRGKSWIAGSFNHGCWLGSYEYDKRRLFEQTVREATTVFDIGAHVGFYTLLGSVLVGPGGRVYAFEPLPRNLWYLREHIRINGIKNATVVEVAVSDRTGQATFDIRPSNSMGHLATDGDLEVRTVTLDDFVYSDGGPVPDYLKVDVEGSELGVLAGAESLLRRRHPIIFLATHGSAVNEECCRFLRSLAYDLRPIGGQANEIIASPRLVRTQCGC
jgi:FkbM family methyltransferase